MLNYHELTMNEARDSPARRQQFLIICTIMASLFFHSTITAGILTSVEITEGIYPGGEYVYKTMIRDYAATGGLMRTISKDLSLSRDSDWVDLLYAVYIDVDSDITMGKRRFYVGSLTEPTAGKSSRSLLMDQNELIPDNPEELNVGDTFGANIKYEEGSLPSVDAAVVQFPFTNGFVSALIHSYKVFPALVKYAKENSEEGNTIIISTTCSFKQQMCTHYAPLLKGKDFYLNRDSSTIYAQTIAHEDKAIDFGAVLKGLKKLFRL